MGACLSHATNKALAAIVAIKDLKFMESPKTLFLKTDLIIEQDYKGG